MKSTPKKEFLYISQDVSFGYKFWTGSDGYHVKHHCNNPNYILNNSKLRTLKIILWDKCVSFMWFGYEQLYSSCFERRTTWRFFTTSVYSHFNTTSSRNMHHGFGYKNLNAPVLFVLHVHICIFMYIYISLSLYLSLSLCLLTCGQSSYKTYFFLPIPYIAYNYYRL